MTNPLSFYEAQPEPTRSCMLALRDVIMRDGRLEATIKYGSPCFTYRSRHLIYIWKDKETQEPYLLFVDGNKMDHPLLEAGDRKRMKVLRVDPNADLPVEVIKGLIEEAIAVRR